MPRGPKIAAKPIKKVSSAEQLRRKLAGHVTPVGGRQAGYYLGKGPRVSKRRSYAGKRVAQMLRQISTRLFFACQAIAREKQRDSPVEVEMMWLNGNVFVATNKNATAESLLEVLADKPALEDWLTRRKLFKSKNSAGTIITTRMAEKLATRVYDANKRERWINSPLAGLEEEDPKYEEADAENVQRAMAVRAADVVRNTDPEELCLRNPFALKRAAGKGRAKLYVLTNGQLRRHAEEKLMDVLEASQIKDERAVVSGKMRPCVTCSGRMLAVKAAGYLIDYVRNPGNVWFGRMASQPREVQCYTTKVIEKERSYISKRGGRGYASESDSEEEGSDSM